MADFVAVLRKTIGSLGENTPEMRDKVYEKARATIEAKLQALNPPPPAAVADRQRKALEDAIAVVRAEYETPVVDEQDEALDDVFASLKNMGDVEAKEPARPVAPAPRPSYQPPADFRRAEPPIEKVETPIARPAAQAPAQPAAPVAVQPAATVAARAVDPAEAEVDLPDENERQSRIERGTPPPARRHAPKEGGRRRGGMVAALLVMLLVVGGGAYALWLNKDDLMSLAGFGPGPASETPAVVAAQDEPEAPAEEEQEVAAVPRPTQTPPASQPATTDPQKFTQRLLTDGSEVDDGPAGGPRSIGEGSSVASAAVPPQTAGAGDNAAAEATAEQDIAAAGTDSDETASNEPVAEAPGGQPAATPPPAGQPSSTPSPQTALAVGQRAIFYEERTSSAQGSAEAGSIVWSVVSESPGGDLPPEPAIRAEATIPAKDVQLRMTIRRNGDDTLPASHIVEMIFLTPEGFDGGSIANVSRIAFKETEQAAGNPLIGIPAKIADGFFLIALGDAPAEIEANMTLLRRQAWVDIPIVYQSGRRALLSLEKGIPGDRAFEEALRAWSEASSG